MPTLAAVLVTLRRAAIALVSATLAATVLAGCSGGSDESGTPSEASSSSARDAGAVATLVAAGLEQMEAGDQAAAKGTFENVLTLDPENLYAHYNLGLIAQREGRDAAAMQSYDAALATDPAFGPALYNKAILTERLDLDEAVSLYRQAVEADPEFAPAFMRLGFALVHLGQDEEGEQFLEEGIRLDPSMTEVQAPSYD